MVHVNGEGKAPKSLERAKLSFTDVADDDGVPLKSVIALDRDGVTVGA